MEWHLRALLWAVLTRFLSNKPACVYLLVVATGGRVVSGALSSNKMADAMLMRHAQRGPAWRVQTHAHTYNTRVFGFRDARLLRSLLIRRTGSQPNASLTNGYINIRGKVISFSFMGVIYLCISRSIPAAPFTPSRVCEVSKKNASCLLIPPDPPRPLAPCNIQDWVTKMARRAERALPR